MIRYVWVFIATSVLINFIHLVMYVYFLKPVNGLFQENGPIENLTAGLFLLIFLLGLVLLRNPVMKEKFARRWVLFLLIVGLLGFLDETSYGRIWIGFTDHRLGGVSIDSIHDLIEAGYKNSWLYIPIFIVPLALFLFVILKFRKKIRESFLIKRYHPVYLSMSFFVILAFAAIIMDLPTIHLPNGRNNTPVEEILELNAALALLVSLFSLYKIHLPNKPFS
jgi:hypothetical protein